MRQVDKIFFAFGFRMFWGNTKVIQHVLIQHFPVFLQHRKQRAGK